MPSWGSLPPIAIDPDADEPKYLQMARAMEAHIRSGSIRPHDRLPSENDLNALLGLSRSTIRKALKELESRGCLYSRQGQGSFAVIPDDNGPERGAPSDPGREPAAGRRPAQDAGPDLPRRPPRRRRGLIGLLVPSMLNEIYPQIIRGVEEVAAARGFSVFIGNTYADRDQEFALMQQMLEREVDGLVLEPAQARFDQPGTRTYQLLKSFPLPLVLLDNDIPGLECSRVMLDDFNGGRLATEHLIARGHRNIAHIYKESVLAALDRRDGHLAALDAAGLPRRPEYACPFTEQDEADNAGYLHARKLLALPERPSAIFCYNDDIAIQVLRAVRGQGLRIPQDVSVIGFDNIRSSGLPDVRLTTIEHPKRLCGRWAADILFDQIEQGQAAIRRRIMIYPELVERDTVASPRR